MSNLLCNEYLCLDVPDEWGCCAPKGASTHAHSEHVSLGPYPSQDVFFIPLMNRSNRHVKWGKANFIIPPTCAHSGDYRRTNASALLLAEYTHTKEHGISRRGMSEVE